MSEYGIIEFLEEYIEALKRPIRFKYTNDEKIKKLKQTIELINKLQKEIEELKENNKKLQDKGKELIFEKQELTSALLDSIPKDKIREKIEELLGE